MRYLFLSLTLILSISSALAQVPKNLDYQGILRDEAGEPIANQTVTAQFTILEGSTTGAVVYTEEQSLTSNAYGLIQTKIGNGSAASFAAVDWSQSHFIQVEVDLGDGMKDFGTSALSSVPYALYGEDDDADPTNELQSLSLENNTLSLSNSDETIELSSFLDNTDEQELSLSGSQLSITGGNTVDLGILGANTDEQTLSLSGTELSISDGNTVDLSPLQDGTGTDSQELTLTGNNLSISGGNSVDLSSLSGGTGTDDQALSLTDNTLTLEDGGTVDLSGYLDNTDTQLTEEEVDAYVANNGFLTEESDNQALLLTDNILTLEDGGSVDLSGYLDNTDTQLTEEQVDAFVSNNGYLTEESDDQILSLTDNVLTLEDGGSVNLSVYLDNTDTQLTEEQVDAFVANNGYLTEYTDTQLTEEQVDAFVENNGYLTEQTDDQAISLTGNTLTLEDGGTVDLSTYLDNTDSQVLTLDGTTLSLENGGSVDLSPYAGQNTDSQQLTLIDDELALQNGGTVDLSGYLDNTDAQTLDLNVNNMLSIQNGGPDIDLNKFLDNTDNQALTLDEAILSLENGGSVDLTTFLDNSDDQELALSPGNLLSITNVDAQVDLNRFMDNTDEQTLAEVLSQGADANATAITNLADPTNDQDASTKAYVDSQISAISTLNESGNFELSSKASLLLDIEHTDENGSALTAGEGSGIGQTFIPSTTGSITRIDTKVGDPVDIGGVVGTQITVQIIDGEGFSGSVLGSEDFTVPASGTNTHTLSTFNFTTPVAVSAGNTYTVTFEMTNGSGITHVNGSSNGSYDNGAGFVEGSSMSSTYDLAFAIYIDPAEVTSLTVADGGNVGIGTDNPHTSAALEITSPNQGLLIPRLTAAQRDNIDSPATGLLIYNTDDHEINKYDGSSWLGETVDTDTDEQDLSDVLSQGADAGASRITNLADPSNAQDAATKAYVDQNTESYNSDGDINFEILDYASSTALDANYNPSNYNAQLQHETTVGQSFTALSSGTLTRVRMKYAVPNSSVGAFTLSIRSGQSLSGTILYSAAVTPTTSNQLSTADVTLSSEVNVVKGQKYTITISASGSDIYMIANYGDEYSGGIAMGNLTGNFTSGDNYFQTYVLSRSDAKTAIYANNERAGIFTDSPDASAALEVNSTTGGLLMPRMTTTERDAISSPAAGLMIFNTTTSKFNGYDGTSWVELH